MSDIRPIEQNEADSKKAAEDWNKRLAERTGTTVFDQRKSLDSSRSELRTHFTLIDPVFEQAKRRPHDPSVYITKGFIAGEPGYQDGDKSPEVVRVLLPQLASDNFVIIESAITESDKVDDLSTLAEKSKFRLPSIWKKGPRQANPYKYTVITVPFSKDPSRDYANMRKENELLKKGDLRAWSLTQRQNPDSRRFELINFYSRENLLIPGSAQSNETSIWSLVFGTSRYPTREPTHLVYVGSKPIINLPLPRSNDIAGQEVSIALSDGKMKIDTRANESWQDDLTNSRIVDGKIVDEEDGKPIDGLDFHNITESFIAGMEQVLKDAGAYK